jgi:hypothetical protein
MAKSDDETRARLAGIDAKYKSLLEETQRLRAARAVLEEERRYRSGDEQAFRARVEKAGLLAFLGLRLPPPFPLDDETWRALSRKVGLPDSARHEVVAILALPHTERPTYEVKTSVLKLATDMDDLSERLREYREYGLFVADRLDADARFVRWTSCQLSRDKPGNKTAASDSLTRDVDDLLRRHTPYRLTNATKPDDPALDFLAVCFNLLKIDTKPETAVRRLVARR